MYISPPSKKCLFKQLQFLQNSCERERQVILMASAMAFPPTVCAQWPVGNTPRLTYSHSSGYLHIFAHTTLHRNVVRKRKKTGFYSCLLFQGHIIDLKRFSIYLSLLWMQRSRQRFVLINPFLHISNPLNMQRPMKTSPAELHLVFSTQTSIPWKLIVSPIPFYI